LLVGHNNAQFIAVFDLDSLQALGLDPYAEWILSAIHRGFRPRHPGGLARGRPD